MKKILTIAAALCVVASVSAKKPMAQILPAQGDFAINVDADPFFNYMGGIFSRTDAEAPEFGNDFGIMGKYFIQDDRAIRGGIDLSFGTNTDTYLVPDAENAEEMVEDKEKTSLFDITIYGGYEWRRGYGRLQGFYGGQGYIGYASYTEKFEYGNGAEDGDLLKSKYPGTFSFGAQGFVGVEYFFAAKMSIAGEVGLGLGLEFQGKGKQEFQGQDDEEGTFKNNNFGFETTNYNRITLNFHF